MDNFSFLHNFDALDLPRLHREDGITPDEIVQVFEKDSFRFRQEGKPALSEAIFIKIEYSKKKRILLIAFTTDGETVYFIGAKVAGQDEIDLYYCRS